MITATPSWPWDDDADIRAMLPARVWVCAPLLLLITSHTLMHVARGRGIEGSRRARRDDRHNTGAEVADAIRDPSADRMPPLMAGGHR
jgi:hypothetical protein